MTHRNYNPEEVSRAYTRLYSFYPKAVCSTDWYGKPDRRPTRWIVEVNGTTSKPMNKATAARYMNEICDAALTVRNEVKSAMKYFDQRGIISVSVDDVVEHFGGMIDRTYVEGCMHYLMNCGLLCKVTSVQYGTEYQLGKYNFDD